MEICNIGGLHWDFENDDDNDDSLDLLFPCLKSSSQSSVYYESPYDNLEEKENIEKPIPFAKKLLVLDLDSTLIYGNVNTKQGETYDFTVGDWKIKKRPNLDKFLTLLVEIGYHLAVWSAGAPAYVTEVCDHLFPQYKLEFIWSRDRCTPKMKISPDNLHCSKYYLKKINKIKKSKNWTRDAILHLDDTPETFQKNYGNGVQIVPYFGETDDDVLLYFWPFLRDWFFCGNVQKIEKRTPIVKYFSVL